MSVDHFVENHFVENHFVENHFVKSHKVDQKYGGGSLCQQYLWRSGMLTLAYNL